MADKVDMSAVVQSPEFKEAVAAAVAAAMVQLAPRPAAPGLDSDTKQMFSEMALSIAQMNHQGSGRAKPVAPEEMARREAGAHALDELLAEVNQHFRKAQFENDSEALKTWAPRYRVIALTYINEELVKPFLPNTEKGKPPVARKIYYTGRPNMAMRPLNDIARRIYKLACEAIGTVPQLDQASYTDANGRKAVVAPDHRPFFMTAGGNAVTGVSASMQERGMRFPDMPAADDDDDSFRIPGDPRATEMHVLGTIHPPARNGAMS